MFLHLNFKYEERETDLGTIAKSKDQDLAALHGQIGEMQKRIQEVFAENIAMKKEVDLLLSPEREFS